MEPEQLRNAIKEAFASVPKPSHDDIAPHRCLECNELAADLAGYGAGDIPEEVFRKHVRDLPLLSAEAKHFYLPAWLTRCIEVDGPWLPDECSAVLYGLEDPEHRWNPDPPFTREQWKVIADWLEHVSQFADEIDMENVEKAQKRVNNEL